MGLKMDNSERIGSGYPHDQQICQDIEEIVKTNETSLRDVLDSFIIYTRRINLTRFIIHYELFKLVKDLPGSFVECGVYRGAGLFTWAKLLEIYCPGDRIRKVIGFDNFRGFEKLSEQDGEEKLENSKKVGGWNAGVYYEELLQHVDLFHRDSFIPRAKRIELVEGDLCKTADEYVRNNQGLRISLLNLDVDVYEPTLAALKAFYPLVVPGGVIILDEYAMTQWPGESKAFEEYFGSNLPKLIKSPLGSAPGAYFIKE
jgi:hypothetical protein